MSINLNNPAYANLNLYTVLAASGITSVPSPTTITNCAYGTPAGAGVTGTYVGSPDYVHAQVAQTELTAFVCAINSYTTGLPLAPLGTIINTSQTIYPNRNYKSASSITFSNNIIIDAQGNSDALFFITAGTANIVFSTVPSFYTSTLFCLKHYFMFS
jgi:hypothetical protein